MGDVIHLKLISALEIPSTHQKSFVVNENISSTIGSIHVQGVARYAFEAYL